MSRKSTRKKRSRETSNDSTFNLNKPKKKKRNLGRPIKKKGKKTKTVRIGLKFSEKLMKDFSIPGKTPFDKIEHLYQFHEKYQSSFEVVQKLYINQLNKIQGLQRENEKLRERLDFWRECCLEYSKKCFYAEIKLREQLDKINQLEKEIETGKVKITVEDMNDPQVLIFTGFKTKKEFLLEYGKFKDKLETLPLDVWKKDYEEKMKKFPKNWLKDDDLINEVKKAKQEAVNLEKARKAKHGRNRSLSTLNIFLLFCVRMRRGFSIGSLGYLFNISPSRAAAYSHFVAFCIHDSLKKNNYFHLLTGDELNRKTPKRTKFWRKDWIKKFDHWINEVKRFLGLIGEKVSESELDCHGWTELISVNYGTYSDTRVFNEAGWEDKFEKIISQNNFLVPIDKGMTDLHFKSPLLSQAAPLRVEDGKQLSQEDSDFGYQVSSSRIAIEQSYARVKSYKLLQRTLHLADALHLEDYVAVAFYWSNEYRELLTK